MMAAETKLQSQKTWSLMRYARFVADRKTITTRKPNSDLPNGIWKNWSSSNGPFVFSLDPAGQLVINQGSVCLENIGLPTSKGKLKILAKGHSMLFAVKLKNEVRRFRIMFATAGETDVPSETACTDCTKSVNVFFPVRSINREGQNIGPKTPEVTRESASSLLEGEVSLSKMAQVLIGGDMHTFPSAYLLHPNAASSSWPEDGATGRLVRWCLLDPEFPSFVQQVETELTKIIREDG